MTAAAVFTVHTAGPQVGLHQTCIRCQCLLADATPWAEGRVAIPDSNLDTVSSLGTLDPHGPAWWPVGARIGTDKVPGSTRASCTYVLPDDRELDGDEVLCTPSSLS